MKNSGNNSAIVDSLERENQQLREQLKNNGNNLQVQETDQTSYSDNNSNSQPNHSGTYEITDVNGKKWTFVLNPDETVIVEDGGNTYYGTWSDSYSFDDNPLIKFPSDDYPRLQFPKTVPAFDSWLAIDVENGFIYGDSYNTTTYESKNPKKRLPIKKI